MTNDTKVIEIICNIGGRSISGVSSETRLEDLNIESLDRVEILTELEVAFGISIKDDEGLDAETVGDVIKLVEAKTSL